MYDLLIKNSILVTPESTFAADIAINGEKIAAIGNPGFVTAAKEEFDAAGRYVLPGLIDPHVHMAHPFQGELSADDVRSASTAAAFGGVTTLIDFAIQWDKSLTLVKVVEKRIKEIAKDSVVDFALHAVPTKSTEESIQAVALTKEQGINSFKVYMVYRQQGRMVEDAILYGILEEMRHSGGTLLVHAENVSIAEYNQEKYLAEGLTSAKYFPRYKPNMVEAEAINRVLFLNRMAGSNLYVVHVSTKEGVDLIRTAQANGEHVFAETCTHYLTLTDEVYERPDGHNFICSPPIRSQADADALWQALCDGTLSIISSDHCGFDTRQKNLGGGNFSKTPNGLPGVEVRLPVIYTEGVLKSRITLSQMAALTSTNPAKIFNMYPQKGALLPGSDADLVILDTEKQVILEPKHLHGATDWSPYTGMKLHGFANSTILRGKFLVKDEVFVDNKDGGGNFIRLD